MFVLKERNYSPDAVILCYWRQKMIYLTAVSFSTQLEGMIGMIHLFVIHNIAFNNR